MDCLDTIKSLKINLRRNIGTILIIVEGASDEFELLKQIFRKILNYNYIEKSRNQQDFKNYDEFVMKGNENSRVIVINSKNSNLSSIKKDKDYLNEIYIKLYTEYGIDIKNVNVYFIWDRDDKSNPKKIVKELIEKLGNSIENKNGDMNGLLLLSYPCLESYVISNFDDKTILLKEDNLKKYIKDHDYTISKMNRYMLLKATAMMHKVFLKLDVDKYNLDDFAKTSMKLFEEQEKILSKRKYYYLLSLISLILLDSNIITPRDG